MLNIAEYDVYFFDFDGVVVDTEPVYYQAFLRVWQQYGEDVYVDFPTYYALASLGRELFREKLIERFPQTQGYFPQFFIDRDFVYSMLIRETGIPCMEGLQEMIDYLLERQKVFGVVTNASKRHIQYFRSQLPILQHFQFWVTREDYGAPKPAPDSYRYAYETYASSESRVVGFEDSLKGLRALAGIPATLVAMNPCTLFSQESHSDLSGKKIFTFSSFASLLQLQNHR